MSEASQRVAVVTGGARGIGAGTAKRLASDGLAVAVLDLKEGDCGGDGGRNHLRRRQGARGRRRCQRRRPGAGRCGQGRRRARAARCPDQQRRRDPGQHAVQDDCRRLGHGARHAPARLVPDEQGVPEAHGGPAVRPDRQPVVQLGARQPRSGELLSRQGRPAGLHQDPRDRARPVRHHGQRRRAWLHRHRHDRGHRGPDRRSASRTSRRPRPPASRSAASARRTTSRT